MKAKENKYDSFSKIFAELNDESQDLLINLGRQLLRTHDVVKDIKAKTPKTTKAKKDV